MVSQLRLSLYYGFITPLRKVFFYLTAKAKTATILLGCKYVKKSLESCSSEGGINGLYA